MKPTTRRARLAVHPLESRETPAGIVNVTFVDGNLTIVGDDANNSMLIINAAAGRISIDDTLGDTRFRLNGGEPQPGVTLGGEVTGTMTIRLGDGVDFVRLTYVELYRSLRINGGDGDNTVVLDQGVKVDGNVNIVNDNGYDQTYVVGHVSVGGNLTISNGIGRTLLDDAPTTDLSVGGVLSVSSGLGTDTVSLETAWAVRAGRISIRPGAGDSATTLAPVSGLGVHGDLAVTAGKGFDTVQVGAYDWPTTVGGSVLVNTGEGGSDVRVLGSQLGVGGQIGVAAGAGPNVVYVQQPAGKGTVGGGVRVGLGSDGFAVVRGLSIAGGLRVGGVTYADIGRVDVGRSTVLTAGAGADRVFVSDSTFAGQFALATGSGNDAVWIEAEDRGMYTTTRFDGPVSVATGAGDDLVRVGGRDVLSYPQSWCNFAGPSRWNGGAGTRDEIILQPFNELNGLDPLIVGFEF